MKAFALTFFILCSGCIFAESVNLKCVFKNDIIWSVLGTVNTCRAWNQDDTITDSSNRRVTTIDGSTSTNPSVKVVNIYKSNCFYFPLNLEKFFINLEGIQIIKSKLREVSREDLKEYKNLRYLNLGGNEIKFLEPNLFEFTPKLEEIFLDSNKIAHIDVNIFNNFVGKLSHLWLSGNICQFEDAWNDKSKANRIIEKVQSGSCNDKTVLPTTTTTTTTTILTTTTPKPSISSAEFEALKKLIGDLTTKIETQNSEIKDELKVVKDQNSGVEVELKKVKDELKKVKDELKVVKDQNSGVEVELKKVKDELKEVKDQNSSVKDELKALKDEQTETKKKLDDQNLEMKAGFGNITAQNQQCGTCGGDNVVARIKFIEKALGVHELHNQTN